MIDTHDAVERRRRKGKEKDKGKEG